MKIGCLKQPNGLRPFSTRSLITGICQCIRLRSHDEIVVVQPVNFMRPPLDRDLPPLRHNQRMVPLLLGDRADPVREPQRFGEVLELEDAFKPFDPLHFLDLPVHYMGHQIFNLCVGQGRLAAPTGNTFSTG